MAPYAGFCQGVQRALDVALEASRQGGKCYSLGPLVHNDAVVAYLYEKGIAVAETLDEVETGSVIVIRSHGVSPRVLEEARLRGLRVFDATCPLVGRVQSLARQLREEGYELVVFGDRTHPEVLGILGWVGEKATVIGSPEEARSFAAVKKLGVVAQTTKSEEDFYSVAAELLPKGREIRVFNTVCEATKKRQQAALELCGKVDIMIVVGDKKSSNTRTLATMCQRTGVKTIQVESARDLSPDWFPAGCRVGVTAGASTPDWIIKEVLDKMVEFEGNVATDEIREDAPTREQSFVEMEAEMAESLGKGMDRGSVVTGVVIQVTDDEVMVDVGGKSEGVIPLRELSVRDVSSAKEVVKEGDTIEVYVLRWDDDGTILLSKKRVDMKKAMDRLEEAFRNGEVIEGTVLKSVKGGLLVDVGVVAFLPASHVDQGFARNLEEYVGQTLPVKVIEFNRNKRRGSQVVVSRKEVLIEEKERKRKEFWDNIEEGQIRQGVVKRLTDYGAFIDLDGYEGLLHISEMAHSRVEHPSQVLTEGSVIEVYVLGVDREKERVSLSRKKILKSPWETVAERYHEGDVVAGKVVRTAPFGVFVELEPGVDGLVHISQLSRKRVDKPEDVVEVGEEVKVKVLSVDPAEKRIGLSIKELQEGADPAFTQEYLENQNT
ncbi:MAG: bifunctional 4-hydroxy-3-methylbut-2-enyl diphosphate reductase/30S ribosomal protein S1 [Syntrophothermus sp.]|nr:bifunctional 4-hydroxy-3-methylbut-2-enyl diphosphate reductase/30S ribosomal protein S1 [Syntrophothermus sp.]